MSRVCDIIDNIELSRDTIRTKLVSWGRATSTDKLETLASSISLIPDNGTPVLNIVEGETYTITAGYYHGGTISAVAGGGDYDLLEVTGIIPSTNLLVIAPDEGYYGLSSVTVEPIPTKYKDTTGTNAVAGEILNGKVVVTTAGTVTGTMPNRGAYTLPISVPTTWGGGTGNSWTYNTTIPNGYHNGSGKSVIVLLRKTVTPTKSTQTITPDTTDSSLGNPTALHSVTVNPIPDNYPDASTVNAVASNVLSGQIAVVNTSTTSTPHYEATAGTMPNNGAVNITLNGTTTSYTVPLGYHNGTGKVQIVTESPTITADTTAKTVTATSGKVIKQVTVNPTPVETKTATPTTSTQTITPSTGKHLSQVTINAIPSNFVDATDVDATSDLVREGFSAVVFNATTLAWEVADGTMDDHGQVTTTLDTTTKTYTISKGYYEGGTISVTTEDRTVTAGTSDVSISANTGKVIKTVTVSPTPSTAKTVTAGTSATTVSPDTGKLLSSVTVNPTPSETKSATPTKSQLTISPSSGKLLSSVTVNAIPAQYPDASTVTAVAANVLEDTIAVVNTGTSASPTYTATEGTMVNRGAVSVTLDTTTTSYTVPVGYHNGSGKVLIVTETKTVTPSTSSQLVTPTSGKVLSQVTVNAIPSKFVNSETVDAVAANILSGKKAVVKTGTSTWAVATGTMANHSSSGLVFDPCSPSDITQDPYMLIPLGYYDGTGKITLDPDFIEWLESI